MNIQDQDLLSLEASGPVVSSSYSVDKFDKVPNIHVTVRPLRTPGLRPHGNASTQTSIPSLFHGSGDSFSPNQDGASHPSKQDDDGNTQPNKRDSTTQSIPSSMMIQQPPALGTVTWMINTFGNNMFLNLSPKMLVKILNDLFGTTFLFKLHPFTPIQAIEGLGSSLYQSSILQLVELNIILSFMESIGENYPIPFESYLIFRQAMYEESKAFHMQVLDAPPSSKGSNKPPHKSSRTFQPPSKDPPPYTPTSRHAKVPPPPSGPVAVPSSFSYHSHPPRDISSLSTKSSKRGGSQHHQSHHKS